jgi:hypothetical protein
MNEGMIWTVLIVGAFFPWRLGIFGYWKAEFGGRQAGGEGAALLDFSALIVIAKFDILK